MSVIGERRASPFDRGRTTPELLLHDADAALYRAKALGKDRCELFDASLRAESVRRLGIELMLRQALEQGDLVVHYQPIIDVAPASCTPSRRCCA